MTDVTLVRPGSSPTIRPMESKHPSDLPLTGIRIISLALNLPGPAALLRLKQMGAECLKIDPPAGDPMAIYSPAAHAALHQGIPSEVLNLKSDDGLASLHRRLDQADVLLTSFRPSALRKLGLGGEALRQRHPRLILVEIVGAPGDQAEIAGHDLTYMADQGLVNGLDLPASLFADMAGALLATEAVLAALMDRVRTGVGRHHQVALSSAAEWLGLPRQWHLTTPEGDVGGAHAGYRVYPCRDGRVALAALEPHFIARLFQAMGLPEHTDPRTALARDEVAGFLARHTRDELMQLAQHRDIPLSVLP